MSETIDNNRTVTFADLLAHEQRMDRKLSELVVQLSRFILATPNEMDVFRRHLAEQLKRDNDERKWLAEVVDSALREAGVKR